MLYVIRSIKLSLLLYVFDIYAEQASLHNNHTHARKS